MTLSLPLFNCGDYKVSSVSLRRHGSFPTPPKGYSKVYEVSGDEITERKDDPDWETVRQARGELARDAEKRSAEQAERERHEELVRKAGSIRFWHYCESCGKKELLTTDEAFDQGWDYPPRMYKFRLLSPRTCGNCLITLTLYWRLMTGESSFFELGEHDREILERISHEPESLMPEDELQHINPPTGATST